MADWKGFQVKLLRFTKAFIKIVENAILEYLYYLHFKILDPFRTIQTLK